MLSMIHTLNGQSSEVLCQADYNLQPQYYAATYSSDQLFVCHTASVVSYAVL
jgi:hypothetical protein